jgi:hypothetical protein
MRCASTGLIMCLRTELVKLQAMFHVSTWHKRRWFKADINIIIDDITHATCKCIYIRFSCACLYRPYNSVCVCVCVYIDTHTHTHTHTHIVVSLFTYTSFPAGLFAYISSKKNIGHATSISSDWVLSMPVMHQDSNVTAGPMCKKWLVIGWTSWRLMRCSVT